MYCVEFIEKMIRGLTRLNRSKSLISESEDQRALGSVRKETLLRAVSDPTQWICLKSQPEKKQTKSTNFASLQTRAKQMGGILGKKNG